MMMWCLHQRLTHCFLTRIFLSLLVVTPKTSDKLSQQLISKFLDNTWRETLKAPDKSPLAIGHIAGKRPFPPIPSTKDGWWSFTTDGPPAARDTDNGAAVSTWKRKAATLWLIPPAWEWDRDWYREQDWQNRKQWVLVPVSDHREHFYMTLYFAFGPCTLTGPFLVQCGYTIRGKHVETLLTLLNNRSNVDQQLNRIRKYVALNTFLILTAISPIFFWNWKLHQFFFSKFDHLASVHLNIGSLLGIHCSCNSTGQTTSTKWRYYCVDFWKIF